MYSQMEKKTVKILLVGNIHEHKCRASFFLYINQLNRPQQSWKHVTFFTVSLLRKRTHERGAKYLSQHHTVIKYSSQDLN